MDPFWNNIYDDTKDRRYGTLFIVTCLFVIGLLPLIIVPVSGLFANVGDIVGAFPESSEFPIICLFVLAGVLLSTAAIFKRRRCRVGHRIRCEQLRKSLSRDELLKARLKLKRQLQTVKFRAVERPRKQPALRAPDIDLKY